MNMFPISPFLSKTIVSAALDFGYLCSVIDIVSMLSTENIFVIPNSDKKKQAEAIHASLGHETGDHLTLLNIMNTWRARGYSREWCGRNYMHYRALDTARRISEQLRQICCTAFGNIDNTPKKSHPYSEPEAVLRSFCSGFYMNTAKRLRKSGVYYHYLTSLLVKEESHSKSDTEPNAGSPDYHNLQPLVCNTAYKDTGLLALFLHQTSMLCNRSYSQVHALGDSDAEWLIYKDLYYCKRPMMRVVSKIQYSWVDKYMDLPLRFIDYNLLSGGNPKTPASTTDGITSSASFSGGPDKEPLGPEPSGHSENDVAPLNPKSGDSACFRRHGRDHIELERPHKTSKDRDDTERQLIIDAARDRYEKRKKLRNR